MGAHNFWNNFTHGFMHGVFNNNPFFGCMHWGWSFNSWCNPFNSCFSPFPAMMYTYPVMSPASIFPLMPNISMPPMPDFTIDVNKLFPTDKWPESSYSEFNFGDIFEKNSKNEQNNNVIPKISIQNTDYTFSFIGQNYSEAPKTRTPKISNNSSAASAAGYRASSAGSSSALASLKGKHWTEMTDEEMKLVYGNYTRDITKLYEGTAEDLNEYLRGKGVLEGQGQAFIDAQRRYGISAAVLIGIAMNESTGGQSKNARMRNNIGGVRIPGTTTFKTYSSVAECINDMARFLNSGYVNNKGRALTKLYQVNAKYCPSSDYTDKDNINSFWARNVEKYVSEVETALV